MKCIELTKGYFCKVDDEDYEMLSTFSWYASVHKTNVYAVRTIPFSNSKKISMHRQLKNVYDSKIKVDHKNRDSLDNQKDNIRICSQGQNTKNRSKYGKTPAKGVCLGTYKFEANITNNGKRKFLGSFPTLKEASDAYDKAARELHGEFASPNSEVNYKKFDYDDLKGVEQTPKWFWNLLTLDLRLTTHDYKRASGEVVCNVCSRKLYDHPVYTTGLNLTCAGELVHL